MADQNQQRGEGVLPDGRTLSEDVIEIILSNLPVKLLLTLKSVSRSWRSLISSRRFKKLHLLRQSVIGNKILLFTSRNNDRYQSAGANNLSYKFRALSVTTKQNDHRKLPPLLSYDAVDFQIIATGSGLVCLLPTHLFSDPRSEGFILWNPATRKFRHLNSLPFVYIGIGYVEATDDYKIVLWSMTRPSVYSLNSDSWRNLDNDASRFPIGEYIDLNAFVFHGRLHWLIKTCTCCHARDRCVNKLILIVSFDFANEVVSCLGIPDNCQSLFPTMRQIQTLVIMDCLSLVILSLQAVVVTQIDIWFMEIYGVQESWVRKFTIPGLPIPCKWTSYISWNDSEIVFLKSKNEDAESDEKEDELRERILFYDLYSRKMYRLEMESLFNPQPFNIMESLAAVGTVEEAAPIKLVEV